MYFMYKQGGKYLNINFQWDICQVLLADLKNMFGQATLCYQSQISFTNTFDVTYKYKVISLWIYIKLYLRKYVRVQKVNIYARQLWHLPYNGPLLSGRIAKRSSSSLPLSLFNAILYTFLSAFTTWSGLAEYNGITGSLLNSCNT